MSHASETVDQGHGYVNVFTLIMGDQVKSESDGPSTNQALEDAENHIKKAENYSKQAADNVKEACEIVEREASRVRREMGQWHEAMDAMSQKLERVHFPSTVKLNLGGVYFTTSLQTLTKDPNSMLAAMFSGKFETKPCEDGAYFIDRDGTHFRFILNYFRTGKLILPDDATLHKELEEEAEFYQIQGIIDEFKRKLKESEILIENDHRSVLLSWLGHQGGEWRLLFRASRDGWSGKDFHTRCDNKGPTVTIVKSGCYIFGGFTEQPWKSDGEWKQCSQAFLFSMVNPSGLGPTKMALRNDKTGIACNSNCGPTFGEGHDLCIAGSTSMNMSMSYLGSSYQCPTGQQGTIFLTGAQYFNVTDYEVFGLPK